MRRFLLNLLRMPLTVYGMANITWRWVIRFALLHLPVMFLAIIINIFLSPSVNLYIGLLFILGACIIASWPRLLITIGAVEVGTDILKADKDLLEKYGKGFSSYLLYISIFFLICGTVHFSRNYNSIITVLFAGITLLLINLKWGLGPSIAKKAIYWYAAGVFVVMFGGLISGPVYVKVLGFDPYAAVRISPVDNMVYEIERKMEINAERKLLKELASIKAKVEKGETLTPAEKEKWEQIKKHQAEKTFPGVVKKTGKKVVAKVKSLFKSDKANASIKPQPKPDYKIYRPGDVFYFKGKAGEYSDHWIRPIWGAHMDFEYQYGKYEIVTRSGKIYPDSNIPKTLIEDFKIHAIVKTDMRIIFR